MEECTLLKSERGTLVADESTRQLILGGSTTESQIWRENSKIDVQIWERHQGREMREMESSS